MSGFKGNKPSKFANRNSEFSTQKRETKPKPEKNKRVKPVKETPRTKPTKKQAHKSTPIREKPVKNNMFNKVGARHQNMQKDKKQEINEEQQSFNVYSYLKNEDYNPDITVEPSRYTKLLIKTLEKRNVAGMVSLKDTNGVMQSIARMVKEVRYLMEDSSDLILEDNMYDHDVNDMGVHQYEPKRKRKRTKVEVI